MPQPSPTPLAWHSLAPRLRACLRERGPLTPRVARECGAPVRVEVLSQGWALPTAAERRLLGLRAGARAMVREVRLHSAGLARVYARSVIPIGVFTGPARQLARLGTRPLGDRLFRLPGIRRESLRLFTLSGTEPGFLRATGRPGRPGERLWGRRSVFALRDQRLSIVEIFLPELLL